MYVILSPEKVRELREEHGLDRRALAGAAELSMGTVRRVEGERGPVALNTGWKIARALDLEHPRVLRATPDPLDSVVGSRRA
jgi:transcriptional regulator with XRE-family HTH domain